MSGGDPKRPHELRLPWLVWVLGLVGVAMSVGAFWLLADRENSLARAHFALHARERVHAIELRIDDARHALVALSSYLAASPQRTRSGFREFTAPIRAHQPEILALSWNPLVTAAERPAHESLGRATFPRYAIRERDPRGRLVPADRRGEHVVPFFIEPHAGNEPALGFDVSSEPDRLRALSRARDTAELALTSRIQLVQQPERRDGVLAFVPVYRPGVPVETPAQRRAALEGYVVAVIAIGGILEAGLSGFAHGDVEIFLYDDTASPDDRLLYAHPAPGSHGARGGLEIPADAHYATEIEAGGRRWRLLVVPTASYLAAHQTLAPAVALASGLVITGLLIAVARRNRRLQAEVVQRNHAERLAVEREERLHLTLDAVADGAWDWNVATGEVYFSDSWLLSLGYERSDVEPNVAFWEEIVHPDDRGRVTEVLRAHFEGRTPIYECENRLRKKSGEYRPNLDRGRVVLRDERGRPLRMLGTDTDITERRRSERERRELEERVRVSQKLESLGVLAGGVAHDFNNLLAAILGGAELALQRLPAASPAREELERIRLVATRAAELTEQLLSYSGKGKFVIERLDLSRLIEETTQLLGTAISKKARLELELTPALPAVEGDPAQLRQVVMNLITNASEALGEEPGRITLRTELLAAPGEALAEQLPPGGYVAIEVSDTGAGMDAETLGRMFDPFFTTKFQGRGLGLAAVQGIVRSHGGAISVESEPKRGTTVRALFPARGVPAAGARANATPTPSEHLAGTVVADDEPEILRIVSTSLAEVGFRVVTAADGRAAVDRFLEEKDSVVAVLLDATMPRMSGREALHEIRTVRPDVPVILSSGYSEEGLVAADTVVGASPIFLHKPYRIARLVAELAAAVRAAGNARSESDPDQPTRDERAAARRPPGTTPP